MSLLPGIHLGPYEILTPLGAGGMGEVYRAKDSKLGREVALKVLPDAFGADAERLRRFEQESRTLAALSHPNIVQVFEAGEHLGAPYLVMELLEGETLRERLHGKPMPPRRAVELANAVAHGLAAAHEKGIIHRDLKPENVFLCRDGRVKILDFGLAKLRAATPSPLAETQSFGSEPGTVVGTSGYMSPEQVEGGTLDARSDLFSLGVVLWEMLTGKGPFQRDSAIETMHAILKEEPPELDPGLKVPPALERILESCLAKAPEGRFHSAHDLAFALGNISDVSGSGKVRTELRKPPRIRARTLLAALALAASCGGIAWRFKPTQQLPSFRQLSFAPGAIESAFFGPDGRTLFYSARVQGRKPELFVLSPDSREPKPLGMDNALLLSVSDTGELAILREPTRTYNVQIGKLAQAPAWGGGIRDLQENVLDATWNPNLKSLALLLFDRREISIECPVGTRVTAFPGVFPPKLLRSSRRGELAVVIWDGSRTAVVVVQPDGRRETVFTSTADGQGESITGMAWHPGTHELWLSEHLNGQSAFWVVSGSRRRLAWRTQGILQLLDIAPDGKLVVTSRVTRRGVLLWSQADGATQEISILSGTTAMDISSDGTKILLLEGLSYRGHNILDTAYLRDESGSPPIRLASGTPYALSDDGRLASILHTSADPTATVRCSVIPTGAGIEKSISLPGFDGAEWLQFTPDGQELYFPANEKGKGQRLFTLALKDGTPTPISPEGVTVWYGSKPLSPDGRRIIGTYGGGAINTFLSPFRTWDPHPVPGLGRGETFIRWRKDGRAIFAFNREELPVKIFMIDPESGRRGLFSTFMPPDPVGLSGMLSVTMTPDGRTIAYNYRRTLGDLFLIEGLK